jgi:hypothetical protein
MNGKNDAFKIMLLKMDELKKLNRETHLCILCAKELDFPGLMQHLQKRQECLEKITAYHEKLNRYLLFMEHNKGNEESASAHAKKEMLFEYLELLDYSMQIDTLGKEYAVLSDALSKELTAAKGKLASPEFHLPLQSTGMVTAESGSIEKARAMN